MNIIYKKIGTIILLLLIGLLAVSYIQKLESEKQENQEIVDARNKYKWIGEGEKIGVNSILIYLEETDQISSDSLVIEAKRFIEIMIQEEKRVLNENNTGG